MTAGDRITTVYQLQAEAAEWAGQKWPPGRRPEPWMHAAKVAEEAGELVGQVVRRHEHLDADEPTEAGDVLVALLLYMTAAGIDPVDAWREAMHKNWERIG